MEELIGLLKEVKSLLQVCNRCGTCQAVCPVFLETGMEADVARGKLALLDGLLDDLLQDPAIVLDQLHRCVMCGSCAHRCPAGVRVLTVFFQARSALTTIRTLPWWKRFLIQNILSGETRRNRWAAAARILEAAFRKPTVPIGAASCARWTSPILRDRHLIRLAEKPFRIPIKTNPKRVAGKKPIILFFTGCLIEHVFPQVAEASIRALDTHGYEVSFAETQECCGLPALAAGDMTSFQRQIRQNISALRDRRFSHLVTACATCLYTIRQLWPKWGPGDASQTREIQRICSNALDISEILSDAPMKIPPRPAVSAADTVVTYHDPCHLKKSLGIEQAPRLLLEASSGYRFREMLEADRCCGMGGFFHLDNPHLSRQIGKKKRERVLSTGSRVVATGCPACMIQLSEIFSFYGDAVQVKHTVEIYAAQREDRYRAPGNGKGFPDN